MTALPNIVLVHGAWADGSSWSAVIERLQADGYRFAADVPPVKAKVMFAIQQRLHCSALGEVMDVPAWQSLPTWFLVADGDQAIPPAAQRQLAPRMGAATVEVATNHVAMVSHPDEVLQLIKTAAEAVSR
jgi:pimeloyl-ACP methyl ester carboxylesterase